jgi:hypothetical protein
VAKWKVDPRLRGIVLRGGAAPPYISGLPTYDPSTTQGGAVAQQAPGVPGGNTIRRIIVVTPFSSDTAVAVAVPPTNKSWLLEWISAPSTPNLSIINVFVAPDTTDPTTFDTLDASTAPPGTFRFLYQDQSGIGGGDRPGWKECNPPLFIPAGSALFLAAEDGYSLDSPGVIQVQEF